MEEPGRQPKLKGQVALVTGAARGLGEPTRTDLPRWVPE